MTEAEAGKRATLRADVLSALEGVERRLRAQGIGMRVITARRSRLKQASLYKSGTKSSNPVSWHELDRAVDCQLYDLASGEGDPFARNSQRYCIYARAAEAEGFKQIGFNVDGSKRELKTASGKPYWDPYHIEYRKPFKTLVEAIAEEKPELSWLMQA